MTTPDTSAVRAWARSNGFVVADRGRLPAQVTDAYVAAHPGGRTSGARTAPKPAAKPAAKPTAKPAAKRTPAKKSGARKKAAVAAAPAEAAPAPDLTPAAPEAAAPPPEPKDSPTPRPKPSVVEDDRRLVALGEQISALADRVAALEAALKPGGKSNGKASRFRRSR